MYVYIDISQLGQLGYSTNYLDCYSRSDIYGANFDVNIMLEYGYNKFLGSMYYIMNKISPTPILEVRHIEGVE